MVSRGCGGYGGKETPGYIPNPEVKLLCADGTALGRVWESRSPPHKFSYGKAHPGRGGPFRVSEGCSFGVARGPLLLPGHRSRLTTCSHRGYPRRWRWRAARSEGRPLWAALSWFRASLASRDVFPTGPAWRWGGLGSVPRGAVHGVGGPFVLPGRRSRLATWPPGGSPMRLAWRGRSLRAVRVVAGPFAVPGRWARPVAWSQWSRARSWGGWVCGAGVGASWGGGLLRRPPGALRLRGRSCGGRPWGFW